MPVVHRGELHLWLGNYPAARADLERAIAIRRRTRWAWYGLAWLEIVTGNPERGLAVCAEGIEAMGDGKTYPPAFACRGEAYRLLGRFDDARAELRRACELTPPRLSAWADLALVHGALGAHEEQAAVFARLVRLAPALVSHAARELGDDVFIGVVLAAPFGENGVTARLPPAMVARVLEHVLVMMRGNRASSLATYFTADGRMHHVPQFGGEQTSPDATRHAVDKVRTVLRRALG
jgi:tetratricopeptide (TPR) repeat protein